MRVSNIDDYKYDWYWQKERATNIMQLKKRPGKVIETISVFYDKQATYNPQKTEIVSITLPGLFFNCIIFVALSFCQYQSYL